jgi:hypothetical protein
MTSERMPNRHICYIVSHGFAARMVLHSDLTAELRKKGIAVTVLVPDSASATLSEFEQPGISVVGAKFQKKRIHTSIGNARRYFREPVRQNAALWSRHLYLAKGEAGLYAKLSAQFNYLMHRVCFRSPAFHRTFDYFDQKVHRSDSIREALEKIRPSLVISTYPVTAMEIATLLEARSLGIPTAGHLLSWDNITCKGRFTAVPDWFISWGPIMSEELQEHYGVEPSRIFDCGVPHFDAHRDLVDQSVNRETLTRLHLGHDKPYLLFGMSAPIFAPHEIDIVEWLAGQIRADRFGKNMQLVIRPHPQNVHGNMADETWLPRLRKLAGPRGALTLPMLREGGISWDMESDDLKILVNLLEGCSICLNSGSTLSIDALAHGKPVIVTLFDADKQLPWWKSARRIRDYPHYKKLIALDGVSPVSSFEELASESERHLDCPDYGAQGRATTIRQECCAIDGGSSQRVALAIEEILGARSANTHSIQCAAPC